MSTAKKSLAAAVKVVNKLDNLPTLPYCTGTFQWNKDKSTLFYKGKSTGGSVHCSKSFLYFIPWRLIDFSIFQRQIPSSEVYPMHAQQEKLSLEILHYLSHRGTKVW